jgi:hypothetical protein
LVKRWDPVGRQGISPSVVAYFTMVPRSAILVTNTSPSRRPDCPAQGDAELAVLKMV